MTNNREEHAAIVPATHGGKGNPSKKGAVVVIEMPSTLWMTDKCNFDYFGKLSCLRDRLQ